MELDEEKICKICKTFENTKLLICCKQKICPSCFNRITKCPFCRHSTLINPINIQFPIIPDNPSFIRPYHSSLNNNANNQSFFRPYHSLNNNQSFLRKSNFRYLYRRTNRPLY